MRGLTNKLYDYRQLFINSFLYRLINIIIFLIMVTVPVLVLRTGLQTNPRIFDFYYDTYLRFFPIIVIIFCMIFQHFNRKEGYLYVGLLILLHIISFNQNYRTEILYLFSTMLVIKKEKINIISNILFYDYGMLFISIVSLSFLNIYPEYFPTTFETTLRQRFSLGFIHPNSTGAAFLSFVFLAMLNMREKVNFWIILSLAGGLIVLNYFIDSRTIFYLGGLLFIYILLDRISEKISHLLNKFMVCLCKILPICLLIFSYLTAYFFNPDIQLFHFINRIMSWRLSLSNQFVREYPVRPFGQIVHFYITETEWKVLDNGYLNVMLNIGMVYVIFILYLTTYISLKLNKMGYKYAPIIGVLIFIYGLTEQSFMTIPFNVLLLFGGALIAESGTPRSSQISHKKKLVERKREK